MDSTLLTAGIILAFTLIIIFFFMVLHKKEKRKQYTKQLQKYNHIVSQNNLQIQESEQFEHYLIALDNVNVKLLYINFSDHEAEEVTIIDLEKIKNLRVQVEENSLHDEKNGKSVFVEKQVSKVNLELNYKDSSKPANVLCFYEVYKDSLEDFNSLKKRISYWKFLIDKTLKS